MAGNVSRKMFNMVPVRVQLFVRYEDRQVSGVARANGAMLLVPGIKHLRRTQVDGLYTRVIQPYL